MPATAGSSPSWSTRASSPGAASAGSAWRGSPQPTHYVDVTGHFEASVASLEAHREYNAALGPDFPAPRDLIQMILGMGGEAAGVEHALLLDVIQRG